MMKVLRTSLLLALLLTATAVLGQTTDNPQVPSTPAEAPATTPTPSSTEPQAGLPSAALTEARRLINAGEAECVLLKGDNIHAVERGHGVSPLLNLYDRLGREGMCGATLVDKVIGRAAACIAICGGVTHVHGELMSEDAITFLADNGISESHTTLVPRILNQRRDGLCPLEQSVLDITDPATALSALRKRVEDLMSGAYVP